MAEMEDGNDLAELLASGSEKPYHAKRPHRKSRAGCRNCKKRKVKCDEKKPSCRTCTLRKETCVYTVSALSPASSSSSSASVPSLELVDNTAPSPSRSPSTSTSVISSPRVYESPPTEIVAHNPGDFLASDAVLSILCQPLFVPMGHDVGDMKLLWAYNASTYRSFATRADGVSKLEHALKVKVIEYATSSPFLMDCVLALTSMHMDWLGRKDLSAPPTKSIIYRAKALEGYRKAVERADPATFPALVACSLLLCALSAQMFFTEDSRYLYILDWLIVWRGIGLILKLMSLKRLGDSGLGTLFLRPPVDLDTSALHIPPNLLFMMTSIKDDDMDFPEIASYYDTLKFLGSLYKELDTQGFSPVLDLRIITYYTFVPARFVELARLRRPRALVIIAHHLAMMKLITTVWWLIGICDPQIRDICGLLQGTEWMGLLGVPQAATRLTDPKDIAKLLLDNHAWEPPETAPFKPHEDPREVWKMSWVDNLGRERFEFPDENEDL
ncbi:hypothetical protein B0H66DRAFT_536071 [Apodospora peruviana]|uniref:Zn(2)-C6 fungal-type domain-containing protein n=1 Tax=Apodospora peruviana TaxID=516989 RepID=A0AAE0HYE1_9PEZI|nr:hypothetical protein B0H66DRAFT_536071 [Apodospora peruviana]